MTTLAHIADGTSSSEPFTVSNSGWGTDTRGLVAVVSAYNASATITHTVTGGGVTWTTAVAREYGGRRSVELFESDGTPSGGDLTIDASGSTGSYVESMYSVDEVAAWLGTGSVVVTTGVSSGTGLTALGISSLGTLTGGQIVYASIGVEGGTTADLVGDDGGATHTSLFTFKTGGSDVRAFLSIDADVDAAPGFTWTNAADAGMLGAILSDGSTGSHGGGGGGGLSVPGITHSFAVTRASNY